jgi:hypothetical protein
MLHQTGAEGGMVTELLDGGDEPQYIVAINVSERTALGIKYTSVIRSNLPVFYS